MTERRRAGYLAGLIGIAAGTAGPAMAQDLRLPDLSSDTRGELQLDERQAVRYAPWRLQAPDEARAGVLMVLPARLGTRATMAPFESAMRAAAFDDTRLDSTSVVNLADASFGAGLMVERELRAEKQRAPAAHFVVDDNGAILDRLGLATGTPHVLLYDCRLRIVRQHSGEFQTAEVRDLVDTLRAALAQPSCRAQADTDAAAPP